MKKLLVIIGCITHGFFVLAEDGYRLWLRYDVIADNPVLRAYRQFIKGWLVDGESPTLAIVKDEISKGLSGLLGIAIPAASLTSDGQLVLLRPKKSVLTV